MYILASFRNGRIMSKNAHSFQSSFRRGVQTVIMYHGYEYSVDDSEAR